MRHAFSLIELAIVLVVIGLLAGGIIAGRSMVRGGELKSVQTEYEKFATAYNAFIGQYNELPGDMVSATTYWGAAAGSTAEGVDDTCAQLTTASVGKATCNGNGSGDIGESTYLTADDRLQFYESFRAWQHLTNAGLLEGKYAGTSGAGRTVLNSYTIGTNVPRTKLNPNAFWQLRSQVAGASLAGVWFQSRWGNILVLGKGANGAEGVLSPGDASAIDTKYDDGKPGYGKILPYMLTTNPNCITADAANASYNLAYTDAACALNFILR